MKRRKKERSITMRTYLSTLNTPWSLFDDVLNDFPFDVLNTAWRARSGQFPRVNVWESEKGLIVEAEVAGADPDKLDVSVDSNVLTIKGEKEQGNEQKAEFQRSFNLPFELDEAKIKATAKNGILTIEVPRKEGSAEKRRIAIEKL
jgi:HSP20 family protein